MSQISKYISILLVIFLSSFTAGDAQVHYQEGLKSIKSENYVKAIGDFTHAISINPQFAEAYFQRARSKDLLGKKVGFNSSELCFDLIQSLTLGHKEALPLLLEKASSECHNMQTAFFEPGMVFCADFSSSVINKLPQKSNDLNVLVHLNLFNNKFVQIGNEFTNFEYLMTLNLSSNNLKSTGSEIGKLKMLINLNLSKNHIEKISKELCDLTNLQNLNLRNNNIKSLPEEISKLENLKELNLSLNELNSLPKGLTNLKNLEKLTLVGNPLSDKDVAELKKALPNTEVYF